jgi:hypothetical protein
MSILNLRRYPMPKIVGAMSLMVVVLLMLAAYNLGKQNSIVKLRSSCDIEKSERQKLKSGYYNIPVS